MKNAIIYLVRSTHYDIGLLNKSIDLLKANFIGLNDIDIIIFHEESLNPFLSFIKNFHSNIIFEEIKFSLPDFYSNYIIPINFPHPFIENMSFPMGYRYMCRFFSGEVFNQKILQKYDNYLRLDTDSFINKMDFNLFEFIKNNNIYYGYISQGVQYDDPGVTKGLWDLAKSIKSFEDIEENKMFYTNFELCNIKWFKNSEYTNFFNKIDKSGGMMTQRWGDAPIRYLGVNMFMNKENIHGFNNIGYQHGSFIC